MEKVFDQVDDSPLKTFKEGITLMSTSIENMIAHPKVKALLQPDVKFDLVISELSLNEALFGKFMSIKLTK